MSDEDNYDSYLLNRIPNKVWAKMTPAQRAWWTAHREKMNEEYEEDKRRRLLKKRGY